MKKIDVTQPYAMSSPFADGVFSSVSTSDFEIPAETSTAPDDTCVIDDGFLPITSTDLDDGGIAPERKNFNGMFYLSTDQRFFLQNGGFITYNSNVATAIGGYPQDAILGFIDSNGVYKLVKSLIDDNSNDFTLDETLIDGIHWTEIAMGGGGSGYQMFDVVPKDHILNYDETKGLAQLGTYVYKEAIAGTRYGYPDFYAKCLEEYNAGTSEQISGDSYTVSNATDTNGVISNFVNNSNVSIPWTSEIDSTYSITLKIRPSSLPSSSATIIYSASRLYVALKSDGHLALRVGDGTNWMGSLQDSTDVIQANNNYYIRVTRNFSQGLERYSILCSDDGITYTNGISIMGANTQGAISIKVGSGVNPFDGSIDLTQSYIVENDSIAWEGPQFVSKNQNGHMFYDIANKAIYDNMYSITGEAWYYGIDTTNERIFLPRSTRIKFGNTTNVGEYQPAGLPDIQGSMRVAQNDSFTGAFSDSTNDSGNLFDRTGSGGWGHPGTLDFKASNSNSIYGNSTTVEYSSTKLIPYMVVGNQSDWSGMTDVVNNGLAILQEVNDGLSTRVELDGSNAQFPYITETYMNGTSGYIIYSNGYCEQWGEVTASNTTVTFLKPFVNTNYNINIGYYDYASPNDKIYAVVQWRDKTTSTVTLQAAYNGNYYNTTIDWCARGYIS